MDQVLTFDKSLQQRLQEFKEVLAGYDVLPVSAIDKEWGFYLELTMDPIGWQAVWKIHRKTCEALNIPFPSVALVLVLSLDFDHLTAVVKILAVQDDIHLPEKHSVPLLQLWPTKDQDKTIQLNLESTANSLDMLRFFYNNLMMPWDYDDDETLDWKSKHLEPRLGLYYDVKNGVLPRVTAEHLHSLITEAKRLQMKKESLESELQEAEDVDGDSLDVGNIQLQSLVELHIRMMQIKSEIDILENPLLRGGVIKKHKEMLPSVDETKQNIWVIFDQSTANEYIQFLSKIETFYPDQILKFSPNLFSTLEYANSNDIFVLKEATHAIKVTGALENGGLLKGVSSREKTILTSNVDTVMLDFRGDHIIIENITIDAISPQCAIIVRRGQLTLKNCKLIGDGKSSTHQGIIVLGGGNLEVINCDISNFGTAVIGNSGSTIAIENSSFHDCNFGLKIFDSCSVKAVKVAIQNCKDYGICVETENNWTGEDQPKVGDFDTLNIIPELQMEFIKGTNNIKGDAVINQKSKLKAIEDLFDRPDSDPTVCLESDEEMETHQTTVIENGRSSPATI